MAKKSNTSMFRPGLKLSVLITGTAFGLMACSDSGGDAVDDGTTSGSTSMGPTTMGPTTSGTTTTVGTTTSGTTVSTTTSGTTVSTTTSGTTVSTTTSGTTTAGSTTTGGTTMGGTTTGGTMMGAGGTSTGGTSTGAGGTGATTADDFDPMAEDFTCIADWQAILRFRINNFLGADALAEAIAVAENPAGGVYPVGTILQHFPTEAMVKRKAGFSPDTKDWEFFLLTLNQDGTTTIASRGPDITTAQGAACSSCHANSEDQWDFVCNTYVEASGSNCGFAPLGQQQLDSAIAMDPRCD